MGAAGLLALALLAHAADARGEDGRDPEIGPLVAAAAKLIRDHAYPRAPAEAILRGAVHGMAQQLPAPADLVSQPYQGTDHLRGLDAVPTVPAVRLLQEGLGYVRLDRFGPGTAAEMGVALAHLEAQGIRGLVLDLRENAGGRLDQARETAELFLPRGAVIYWERGRGREGTPRLADGPGRPWPLAILIGPRTASAAELLAGALRGNGRAVLLGGPSAGEGYIRTAFPLGQGYVLWLATGEYLLPDQSRVQGRGLLPDLAAEDPARLLELATATLTQWARAGDLTGRAAHTPDNP